ncbi:acyl-CoA N-acyltransferase [Clavulina sp. PMI_390]|nr:acyl-CoA N-acyltransferase [Clavulina sp. PMI_390]
MTNQLYIRPATPADEADVSRICLLTGNAGTTAESVYSIPELIGLTYAVPYLHVPHTFSYVLVATPTPSHPSSPNESTGNAAERVIGYIIGTTDTLAYSAAALRDWWPVQAAKYPVETTPGNADDKRLMGLFAKPDAYAEELVAKVPAHMHINILPEAQGTGWGRRLIDTAINHVRGAGGSAIFLGIDPRNDRARQFYKHVGFKHEPSTHGENYILQFSDWKAPAPLN